MKKIFLTTVLSSLFLSCSSSEGQKTSIKAFTHVRVIDGRGGAPLEDVTVLVRDENIVGIEDAKFKLPIDAEVYDLSGKTMMPGIVSNHNHIGSVDGLKVDPANYTQENIQKERKVFEGYGVTTITSLGVNSTLIYKIKKDQTSGADVFAADRGIGVYAGAPPLPTSFDELMVSRPKTPQDARAVVREMKERGSDLIKLWVDDFLGTLPKMKPEIYRAVIDEAHKNDLKVVAHVYYLSDAKALAQAGVDMLGHGIRNQEVDSGLVKILKEKGVVYIPTLGLDESFYIYGERPEWLEDKFFTSAVHPETLSKLKDKEFRKTLLADKKVAIRKKALKMNQKNVKKLFDAGARVGFGTDSGANPWRIQGFAEHRELELLVEAGLTPLEAIKTATMNGADTLGLTDRGIIDIGKRADFIVLKENPAENILNTRKIETVWHKGKKIIPAF